jgi:hypothetical protein
VFTTDLLPLTCTTSVLRILTTKSKPKLFYDRRFTANQFILASSPLRLTTSTVIVMVSLLRMNCLSFYNFVLTGNRTLPWTLRLLYWAKRCHGNVYQFRGNGPLSRMRAFNGSCYPACVNSSTTARFQGYELNEAPSSNGLGVMSHSYKVPFIRYDMKRERTISGSYTGCTFYRETEREHRTGRLHCHTVPTMFFHWLHSFSGGKRINILYHLILWKFSWKVTTNPRLPELY